MDPTSLVGPSNPLGYPAPYWFLVSFKVLGFALHAVPMNLWYAGVILFMLLYLRGGANGRRLVGRLMKQMPIIVAYGINLGIIPLLFTQVAYYKVFYPATILMAWPWLSIIGLLTIAYYGIYVYIAGLRGDRLRWFNLAAGWVSAVLFIVMGFIFANGFSLMVNLDDWPSLWRGSDMGGAPLGLALNTGDPSLWPRWLMMFGLALTTTAAYIVVDTAFFAGKESAEYRRWATDLAFKVYTVGIVWFAVTGSWYAFGTWPSEARAAMFGGPQALLTALTAVGPGLPWLLILAQRRRLTRRLALFTGLAQFGVLALNAISRQVLQNVELSRFLDVTAEQVRMQWSPLLVFLILFVAWLSVTFWMISKVVEAERQAVGSAG